MHILHGKRIDIHDHWDESRSFDEFGQFINLVFLSGNKNYRHIALLIF